MNYIDCHNHLLPKVDDGSQSLEESLDNLRKLRSQGVTAAILTPHVNSPFASLPGVTKESIRRRFDTLNAVCEKTPELYPALSLGCEYYFDPAVHKSMDPIPMAGSDIVMLELPYEVELSGVVRAAEIARGQGYRVLLAHPEKYDAFKFQWDEALDFLRSSPDVLVQLESWNIGKRDEYSWRFIETRTAAVIGSDSHGNHRSPSFGLAVSALQDWAKGEYDREEYVDLLLRRNAEMLWTGLGNPGQRRGERKTPDEHDSETLLTEQAINREFSEAAARNGESAAEILSDFMKDYIVSGGHPEAVVNRWPWNRKGQDSTDADDTEGGDKMGNGTVCFDFDGVIHSYVSGFLGDESIPDPPVPGIKEVIDRLREAGYSVVVLSSRSATHEGRVAMRRWFEYWGITVDDICSKKPPARCYVDDRAVPFNGDTSGLFETIDSFEPWWKKLPENAGTADSDPVPKHLLGAIVGDIVGSIYEHDNIHTEDFPLFGRGCFVTDDTTMTLAVARALVNAKKNPDLAVYDELVDCMRSFGRHYPDMGYGGRFMRWIWSEEREPYDSWGNGAPMRCSAAGWITNDAGKAYALGAATAEPTHNHPYATKAAGTVAGLICLARDGMDMEDLRTYAENQGYKIPTMDWLLKNYKYTESSQGTMPAALACFFNSHSFEDSIRKAISIGGDSDTIAAITGSIAEAYYGIPDDIRQQAWEHLPSKLRKVLVDFNETFFGD